MIIDAMHTLRKYKEQVVTIIENLENQAEVDSSIRSDDYIATVNKLLIIAQDNRINVLQALRLPREQF